MNMCTTTEQSGVVRFLWAKGIAAKDIHKEMLPCMVHIACHVKQSIIGCRSSWKGGEVSKTNIESVSRRIQGRRHVVTGAPSLQPCACRSLHITIKLDSAAN